MAKLFNLARMGTSTTGTGTITLGSAVSGHITFASAGAVTGDVVSYGIIDGTAAEVGIGTYTASGTTLTRTLVNSTTGSLLSLSGSAQVFVTDLASSHIPHDASIAPLPALLGKLSDGTPGWMQPGQAQVFYPFLADGNQQGAGSAALCPAITPDGCGVSLRTGTTATGGVNRNTSSNDAGLWAGMSTPFLPGIGFRCVARFPVASNGTDTYWSAWGYHGGSIYTAPGSYDAGIYFIVNSGLYGDNNIRCVTRASGSGTTTDSGVAVTSDTAILCEHKYDSTGQVRFWINNALVATHTTNIPAATAFAPLMFVLLKSAGTSDRIALFGQLQIPMER